MDSVVTVNARQSALPVGPLVRTAIIYDRPMNMNRCRRLSAPSARGARRVRPDGMPALRKWERPGYLIT